jgi:hypothetical protein
MAPQQGERLPAPRAAVTAAREIPGHLNPRQARVIPPPRPRPRPSLNALRSAGPVVGQTAVTSGTTAGRRIRTRLLRRPAEHHPLQYRQVSAQLLQLGSLPRVLRPQPRVLLAQLADQPRQLPVRLQRGSQHVPQRCLSTLRILDNPSLSRHATQQTPSEAANHVLRCPACRSPQPSWTPTSRHTISEYLRSTGVVPTSPAAPSAVLRNARQTRTPMTH